MMSNKNIYNDSNKCIKIKSLVKGKIQSVNYKIKSANYKIQMANDITKIANYKIRSANYKIQIANDVAKLATEKMKLSIDLLKVANNKIDEFNNTIQFKIYENITLKLKLSQLSKENEDIIKIMNESNLEKDNQIKYLKNMLKKN